MKYFESFEKESVISGYTDYCYKKLIEEAKTKLVHQHYFFFYFLDHGVRLGDAQQCTLDAWTSVAMSMCLITFYAPELITPQARS